VQPVQIQLLEQIVSFLVLLQRAAVEQVVRDWINQTRTVKTVVLVVAELHLVELVLVD
jgi:hypothetical protein